MKLGEHELKFVVYGKTVQIKVYNNFNIMKAGLFFSMDQLQEFKKELAEFEDKLKGELTKVKSAKGA